MRRITLALCALSCATHTAAEPRLPAPPVVSTSAPLAEDLVGWVVLGDLSGLGDPGRIKSELISAIASPELALAIDPKRPLAIALLDWKKHGAEGGRSGAEPREVQPLLLALPLATGASIKDGPLARDGTGPLQVRVKDGVAYVGWEAETAAAAPALLAPVLATPPTSAIVARVLVPNLARLAGDDVEKAVAELMTMTSPDDAKDPHSAFGLRALRGIAPFLRASTAIELRADATKDGVSVALDLEGPAHGEWASYVARRRSGPSWGLKFLPTDAILAFSSRLDPKSDAPSLAAYLGGPGPEIDAFMATLPGELAYATWPSAGGGMGVGGAFATTPDSRARLLAVYRGLGDSLGPLVAHELGASNLRFSTQVLASERIDGVVVDRIDLIAQKPDADVAKVLEWMYGDGVHLGIAFVGNVAVWAAGRDWKPRLATMIAAARGRHEPSILDKPDVAGLDAGGLVSMSRVDPGALAEFITKTLGATSTIGSDEEAVLAPFKTPGATVSILTTTRVVRRDGAAVYEAKSVVPTAVLADVGHIGGAFWRVGISLLAGPPSEIPIPVPPRDVTPPPHAVSPSEGPREHEHQAPQPGLPPAHKT